MRTRSPVHKDLRTAKYRKRVVKPRKGKGAFRRKPKKEDRS